MDINGLYSSYKESRDDSILAQLARQSVFYCIAIYKKNPNRYRLITKEEAAEIAEMTALRCSRRCLDEDVGCFKRCLGRHFKWAMADRMEKLIKEQRIQYIGSLRNELGLQPSELPDDELISCLDRRRDKKPESLEHTARDRSMDFLKFYNECLTDDEKRVLQLYAYNTPEEIARIMHIPKQKVIKIKHKAKKKFLEYMKI